MKEEPWGQENAPTFGTRKINAKKLGARKGEGRTLSKARSSPHTALTIGLKRLRLTRIIN